jgi:hypothetical protein
MQARPRTENCREAGLTVFEIFPLLLAVFVMVVSGTILTKRYGDSALIWVISAALGAGSWILYALVILRWRR